MMHKHHIIPKHVGGSNDPSNFVKLTVAEHAEAHRILFQRFGRWQDELAWLSLSKQITCEQARILAVKATLTGRPKSLEHKINISISKKGKKQSSEHIAKRSTALSGKPKPARSPEHCAKIAAAWQAKRIDGAIAHP